VIVLKESTQSWTTGDWHIAPGLGADGEQQHVSHSLMISFVVVVGHELANGAPQRIFADEDQSVETRFFNGPNEALRVCVEIWGTRRQADGLDTRRAQGLAKRLGEERIAIVNQVAFPDKASLDRIADLPTAVNHAVTIWLRYDAGDFNVARRQVDYEEDGEAGESALNPDFDGEEVGGREDAPVSAQELLSGRSVLPLRRRINAVFFQDVGNCPSADRVRRMR
jgi:hypothetical protein